MNIFRLAAMLTVMIEGHPLLALVATSRMKAEYDGWLPPFGYDFVDSIPPDRIRSSGRMDGLLGYRLPLFRQSQDTN